MNWLPILVIIAVVVLILYFQKCNLNCGPQHEGMLPSIRNFATRLGPDEGAPIDKFAAQVDAYKAEFRKKADSIGCGQACRASREKCLKCFHDTETLVIGVMPLDIPNPKPGYRRKDRHPWRVPKEIEFDEQFRKSSCMACS
uniref:Uncharacterized protein n=1 Tax=Marseillevirus LCMAC101 TaxID=2506602 RepID=A0A481YQX4_9VIRU|nr:MAG: hypothetical protein LCMAC101_01970 [Marseillevirus LCMAC101]